MKRAQSSSFSKIESDLNSVDIGGGTANRPLRKMEIQGSRLDIFFQFFIH